MSSDDGAPSSKPNGGGRSGRRIAGLLGAVCVLPVALAAAMLLVCVWLGELSHVVGYLTLGGAGALASIVLRFAGRKGGPADNTTAMAGAALAWLLLAALFTIPFLYAGEVLGDPSFSSPFDALFESMSGLTSTGLTVVSAPESLPKNLQLFRSLLEWVGGIGLVFLALLLVSPFEAHDGSTETELSTRIDANRRTGMSRRVWAIYAIYTSGAIVSFGLAGMPWWEALNHGMTAVSTGGFTVTSSSFSSYGPAIKLCAVVFMLLGAIGFGTHYRLLFRAGRRDTLRSAQLRLLAFTLIAGPLALGGVLAGAGGAAGSIDVVFQWVSASTTSGFSTVTIGDWPRASWVILMAAMLAGGGMGSTAGGVKLQRVALALKSVVWHFRGLDGRTHFRLGRESFDAEEARERLHRLVVVALCFLSSWTAGTVLLLWSVGFAEAAGPVAFDALSALCGVGLSSGFTGAGLPAEAKLLLSALMWMGRLEVTAALLLGAGLLRILGSGE